VRGGDITVAIPSLGRWQALGGCLESLDRQVGGPPHEAICVVNGPTGPVPSSLRRPWLRFVHDEARGVSRARNTALALASSRWVLFIDDDCIAPASWLDDAERMVQCAPGIALAGGPVVEPPRPGRIYSFMRKLNYMRSNESLKFRHGIPSFGGANLLVNVSAVRDLGGFNDVLVSTEDFDLVLRSTRSGLAVASQYFGAPVSHVHDTSLTTFVRRYFSYGQGVGQVVRLHGLDAAAHRIYTDGRVRHVLGAVRRFASEDLAWIVDHGEQLGVSDRALALLRAAAWQAGALRGPRP
jgi:GT2 family glycosyltransferase